MTNLANVFPVFFKSPCKAELIDDQGSLKLLKKFLTPVLISEGNIDKTDPFQDFDVE